MNSFRDHSIEYEICRNANLSGRIQQKYAMHQAHTDNDVDPALVLSFCTKRHMQSSFSGYSLQTYDGEFVFLSQTKPVNFPQLVLGFKGCRTQMQSSRQY